MTHCHLVAYVVLIALIPPLVSPAFASDICTRFNDYRAQIETAQTLVFECEATVKMGGDYREVCNRFLRYNQKVHANRLVLDAEAAKRADDLSDGYADLAIECGLSQHDISRIATNSKNIAHSSKVIAEHLSAR